MLGGGKLKKALSRLSINLKPELPAALAQFLFKPAKEYSIHSLSLDGDEFHIMGISP
jgi:hypothetical protein